MPRHFIQTAEELEEGEYLQHFGVKGMKWGRRTGGADDSGGGGTRREARAAKSLAKAQTKLAVKTAKIDAANKRDDDINAARENLGKTANAVKVAKAQYKVDKHLMGRKAAKDVLRSVKNTNAATISLASQKTGQEQAAARKELYTKIAVGALRAIS